MIKVALIGTGYWGPNVANSFKAAEKVDLRWICDVNPDVLSAFSAKHPDTRATTETADVFADPDVDAVAIATPTATHYGLVKTAIEAGKHVFVEKPLTASIAEAEELVSLAESRDRILMVGHVFQYNNSLRALKDIITSGDLGEINYLSLIRTNLGPVRTDVSALWDLMSHDTYIMADLLNEQPQAVSAIGRAFLNPEIEDVVFATFSFACGALAHVHASWLHPRKVRQITVVGTKKMAVWDDLNLQEPIRLYDKRVEPPQRGVLEGTFIEHKTMVVDGGSTAPRVQLNQPLQTECAHFIECVDRDLKPRSGGREGLAAVRALTAACESLRNGGVLTPIP